MAVGTGTALLASAALSGGLQLFGAKKTADASNKAADQQVDASGKGLALQQQIYGQQVAGMQPYAQVGQQALGSLGSLMGFPPVSGAAPPMTPQMMGQQDPFTLGPDKMNMNDPKIRHLANGGSLIDPEMQGGTLGSAMTRSGYQGPSVGSAVPRQGGSFTTGGGMVTLQAPTGEMQQVPEAQAGHFISAGAKRVG